MQHCQNENVIYGCYTNNTIKIIPTAHTNMLPREYYVTLPRVIIERVKPNHAVSTKTNSNAVAVTAAPPAPSAAGTARAPAPQNASPEAGALFTRHPAHSPQRRGTEGLHSIRPGALKQAPSSPVTLSIVPNAGELRACTPSARGRVQRGEGCLPLFLLRRLLRHERTLSSLQLRHGDEVRHQR